MASEPVLRPQILWASSSNEGEKSTVVYSNVANCKDVPNQRVSEQAGTVQCDSLASAETLKCF